MTAWGVEEIAYAVTDTLSSDGRVRLKSASKEKNIRVDLTMKSVPTGPCVEDLILRWQCDFYMFWKH